MNLGIEGSTLPRSKISFACLSLAIDIPPVDASVIFCATGRGTDVEPVSPVYAVPDIEAMISSS